MRRREISKQQREEIIAAYLDQSPEAAQRIADRLLLAPDYAVKLMRARGLLPRVFKRWGHLVEVGL